MGNLRTGWLAIGAFLVSRPWRDGGSVAAKASGRSGIQVRFHLLAVDNLFPVEPEFDHGGAERVRIDAADRIPGAKLVTIESGGHMLLGQEERVRSEIVGFSEETQRETYLAPPVRGGAGSATN